jgi:hypothetical protein
VSNVTADALAHLLADALVAAVTKLASDKHAAATMLINVAETFIADNNEDVTSASASLAAITAGITDPALKDLALTGLTIAGNNIKVIKNLTSITMLGTALTAVLNGFWGQVVTVAQGYQAAAAPATPPAA